MCIGEGWFRVTATFRRPSALDLSDQLTAATHDQVIMPNRKPQAYSEKVMRKTARLETRSKVSWHRLLTSSNASPPQGQSQKQARWSNWYEMRPTR